MRRTLSLVILLCAVLAVGSAQAGRSGTGLYLGAAGQYLLMDGTGTWDGVDFEIDSEFGAEEKAGLFWDGKGLFGVHPFLGYRFNKKLALQVGYTYFLQKKGEHEDSDTEFAANYQFSAKWDQQTVDAVALFRPNPEGGFFLYGGLEFVSASVEVSTLVMGWGEEYIRFRETYDLSTTGFVIGAGFDKDPGEGSTAPFITAQYSVTEFDETFMDVPDFKVKVGGLSLKAGLKWYFD